MSESESESASEFEWAFKQGKVREGGLSFVNDIDKVGIKLSSIIGMAMMGIIDPKEIAGCNGAPPHIGKYYKHPEKALTKS